MTGITIKMAAGATEADIQKALDKLPSGSTLVLAANQNILIRDGLSIDASSRSISLDLNGSILQQAGDNAVIWVDGRMTPGATATLDTNPAGNVTVSYKGAAKVTVGDYIKIYSDDVLPNDQGAQTRLGQAMKVVAVNGSTLVLEGDLAYADLYKTNVRASEFQSGTVNITNGTVRGDQTHSSWNEALVSVRSAVGTHIDGLTVRDGNSMGINFVNSVNGLVTQTAVMNLTDDTAHGHYGYAVHSASSVGTTINGLYVDKVRHGVDDNAVGLTATHLDPSKYGADLGLTATNVIANGTTSFAFSWHSEGRFSSYSDSLVFNSFGVIGARGTDNTFQNISGVGNERGVLFYEYGDGDGTRITVDNVHLKEGVAYAFYNQNDATGNILSNSTFEVLNKNFLISADSPTVDFLNTTVKAGAFTTDETITGTGGHDRLIGGLGIDTIVGGAGNDYIWGGVGADILTGGAGADRFAYQNVGEAGDTITDFKAGTNGDVIDLAVMSRQLDWKGDLIGNGYVRFVQSGANTLLQVDADGGANSFVKMATLKNVLANTLTTANLSTAIIVSDYDAIDTQGGEASAIVNITPAAAPAIKTDTVLSVGTAKVESGIAFNTLTGMDKILGTTVEDTLKGTDGNNVLIGGGGNDKLYGNDGDDVLAGGSGADYMNGGKGLDTASYADATAGVTVSLFQPAINTGDAAGDRYSQIENLMGSAFADNLTGNNAVNVLNGGNGNDRIYGLGGSDTLFGGAGNDILDGGAKNDILDGGYNNDRLIGGDGFDRLTGGSGADVFVLDPSFRSSFDTITDFVGGTDRIGLAGTGRMSLSGVVLEVDTVSASSANATLLYNSNTGALFWDADGNGKGAAVKIAMLDDMPTLHISDFILI